MIYSRFYSFFIIYKYFMILSKPVIQSRIIQVLGPNLQNL